MNYKLLQEALQNENNDAIYDLSFDNIKKIKKDILNQLDLTQKELSALMSKLKEYKYVDDLNDLRTGSYIRWIYIGNDETHDEYMEDEYYLNKGAIYCDVNITEDGMFIVCKSFSGKHFNLSMNGDYFLFQKLSQQEILILKAIDQLSK